MFVVGRSGFWKSAGVSSTGKSPAAAEIWRDLAWLFLACFALHVAGTWSLPLCDRDEPRFAEASREMLQRGDAIVPWFNNQPRYDKPPLIYWCQIAAYAATGQNEFSARLPSVIASALTSLALYGFGRRLRGRTTGLWAAILFATCAQTIVHSKLAVADMLMILFFTTAAWSAWELSRPSPTAPDRRWWWALGGSLGLAFLAKGPVGLLPALFPFLAARVAGRPAPSRQIRPVRLAIVVLALIALWGIPALVLTHGDFWRVGMGKHVFQRSIGVLDGHGGSNLLKYLATVPLYFGTVFVSFFPWSIWLVWLVRRLWQRKRALEFDEAFLLTGTLLVFGIFSLVRTKLPHYTLPAFPLMGLLLVREWSRAGSSLRWPARAAAGMAALALTLSLVVFPRLAPLFPAKQIARECQPWLRPETALASADYTEPSLCWYFRRHIAGFHKTLTTEELPAFMAETGPRVCLLPTAKVPATFPAVPTAWHRVEVRGFNLANGKPVNLTALVKSD